MTLKRIATTLAGVALLALPFALPATVGAQEIEKNLQCGANLKFDTSDEQYGTEPSRL